ncbi:MAG: hypothetical protein JWQ33_350 [Ramlibacter sp.]|nr:hypothetical protein [Ramlibacter sp.]
MELMAALRREKRGTGLAPLLLIASWLAASAWVRKLSLPDEGRYVGVAWEMLRSGHWLTPTLDGLPYFHKPPLFYWITTAGLWAGGLHEWSARLAPLIGASAAAFSLYLFLRRWCGLPTARASLLVLLTQPFFFIGAQFANLDMLVAGCISVTTLAAADAALRIIDGLPHRKALATAYAAAALGVLAKGLIGAALPSLTVLIWLATLRQWRTVGKLFWLPGMCLFLAIAAPWFILMELRFPSFLNYFFIVQQFDRFTGGGFNNVEPFWFYPVVLAILVLPWSPWLYHAFSRSYLRRLLHDPVALLMWIWLCVVVLFFSWPQSKLIGYVLPALPPLAFLIADASASLRAASGRARKAWLASGIIAAAACWVCVATIAVESRNSKQLIGLSLAAQRQPGEPLIFLREYFYDVPFYARLDAPPLVADAWSNPATPRIDNWRKELWDASRFGGADTLLDEKDLTRVLCAHPVSWVVTSVEEARLFPFLGRSAPIAVVQHTGLYRVDRAALDAAASCVTRMLPR